MFAGSCQAADMVTRTSTYQFLRCEHSVFLVCDKNIDQGKEKEGMWMVNALRRSDHIPMLLLYLWHWTSLASLVIVMSYLLLVGQAAPIETCQWPCYPSDPAEVSSCHGNEVPETEHYEAIYLHTCPRPSTLSDLLVDHSNCV